MSDIRIVVGLGNPGRRYHLTRHNLGHIVLDALGHKYRVRWHSAQRAYWLAETKIGDAEYHLLKPRTYVNRSGEAIERFASESPFDPGELLVVCDDFALPLGQLRLRRQGSDGGHNGLSSIISVLGTRNVPRLRLGVGPPPPGGLPAEYVLERFADDEWPAVHRLVERAVSCVENLASKGFDRTMSEYNAPPSEGELD